MNDRDKPFQRVAQYLDGEPIELTAAERALADDITTGESMLKMLDAPLPAEVMDRARRRMTAAAAKPSLRRRVLQYVVSMEAAAVAGLLIVLGALAVLAPEIPGVLTTVPTRVLVQSVESSVNGDLDVMENEIDDLEADILVSTPAGADEALEIESIQQDMQEFFQGVPSGSVPDTF